MYTAKNPAVYAAAFGGAFVAMTASMRVPSSPDPADYASSAKAAGAWAESFDTEWAGPVSDYQTVAVSKASETTWDGRTAPSTPGAQSASTYTAQVRPLIASISAASSYLAANVLL